MDKILGFLKKIAKLVIVIALLAAAGFTTIASPGMLDDGFFGVIGGSAYAIINLALIVAVPLLFLLKKDELAKTAIRYIGFFWLIYFVLNFIADVSSISYTKGIFVAAYVFELLMAIALVGAIVLFILQKFTKLNFSLIIFILLAATVCLELLVFLLNFIGFCIDGYSWVAFFNEFATVATLIGFAFGFFYIADEVLR